MAVRRHGVVALDRVDDVRDQRAVVARHRVPHRVRDVQGRRAVIDRDLTDLGHELRVRAEPVLGRELHVGGVGPRPCHAGGGLGLHLVTRHAQLLRHVDLGGGDEHVDARPLGVTHRLPSPIDVLEPGARQRSDDRAAHAPGDRLDRLEVAVAGDREPGLDDVDPEARQLLRDLELLARVERDARALLTVSQRRVEDQHAVHGDSFLRGGVSRVWGRSGSGGSGARAGGPVPANKKPPRPVGTRRHRRAPEALAAT